MKLTKKDKNGFVIAELDTKGFILKLSIARSNEFIDFEVNFITSDYDCDHFSLLRRITFSALGSQDSKEIYAISMKVESSGFPYKANKVLWLAGEIQKRIEKEHNRMAPLTFGQYICSLANALDMKEIAIRDWIENQNWNHSKSDFENYAVVPVRNAGVYIDSLISRYLPECSKIMDSL